MMGFFASPQTTSTPAGSLLAGLSAPGAPELIVILVIVLIIFGPKQLPKIGRAIGTGIRELKDAANKMTLDDDEPRDSTKSSPPEDKPAVYTSNDRQKPENEFRDDDASSPRQ